MVVIVHVKKRIAPHAVLRVTCFGIIARVCVPVRGRACARVCVCARAYGLRVRWRFTRNKQIQ